MTPTERERAEAEQAALDGCDDEPIAFIGGIQPHGWLLALDLDDRLAVVYASANLDSCIGQRADDVLGRPVDEVLPGDVVHDIRNAAGHSTIEVAAEAVGRFVPERGVEQLVTAHVAGRRVLVEGIPALDDTSMATLFTDAQRSFARLTATPDLDRLLAVGVQEIRRLIGFARVKAYRFAPDGCGEVVAEDRDDHMASYLGLRFPAEDIPPAARALYTTTPIRVIGDVTAAPVPLVGADPADVDLSLSLLRASADVHLQYLRNMGVRSTMTLPIVVDGAMWGLFSCHHDELRVLDPGRAVLAQTLGWTLSTMVEAAVQRQVASNDAAIEAAVDRLISVEERPARFSLDFYSAADHLCTLVTGDGVAIATGDTITRHGSCPSEAAVRATIDAVRADPASGTAPARSTGHLAGLIDDVDVTPSCGALVLDSPLRDLDALVFFRNEAAEGVRWAGAPTKTIVDGDQGPRLEPRRSFGVYQEHMAGRSVPWSDEQVRIGRALVEALARVTDRVDRTERDWLNLLVRELNHRVRNILALVGSIAHHAGSATDDVREFIDLLEGRLGALSQAHGMLTEVGWQGTPLPDLLQRLAAPHTTDDRVRLSGPDVVVDGDSTSTLTLVFHELLTNASKYGALSNDGGWVDITWSVAEAGVEIRWRERGGPPVVVPQHSGFGTMVIRDGAAVQLAEAELAFDPEGVTARFVLAEANTSTADAAPTSLRPPHGNDGLSVLVVEDDFLIAMRTRQHLETLGVEHVETCGSVAAALDAIAARRFDHAVLDVALREETSMPISTELSRSGIPFVFVTGYSADDDALVSAGATAILTKPVSLADLATALDLELHP